MSTPKRKSNLNKSIGELRPRELDEHLTFMLEERPIAGGLPFWPFNRTRLVEMHVPPDWLPERLKTPAPSDESE